MGSTDFGRAISQPVVDRDISLSQSSTAISQSVVDDKAEDQVEHRLHAIEREEQRDASDDDDGQGAEESVLRRNG
jgi:hypothetical protein